MATITADELSTPPGVAPSSLDQLLARPELGAGITYPAASQGISLQLGSLAILLGLLWASRRRSSTRRA